MPEKYRTLVETPVFTKIAKASLSDEEYLALQVELARNPEAGALIPRGGGVRKLRWGGSGTGKRGGFRVIYYLAVAAEVVLMLYMYDKSVAGDLTQDEIKALAKVVKEEFK